VDITGDLDVVKEEEEGFKGESDLRGAHPDSYLFI